MVMSVGTVRTAFSGWSERLVGQWRKKDVGWGLVHHRVSPCPTPFPSHPMGPPPVGVQSRVVMVVSCFFQAVGRSKWVGRGWRGLTGRAGGSSFTEARKWSYCSRRLLVVARFDGVAGSSCPMCSPAVLPGQPSCFSVCRRMLLLCQWVSEVDEEVLIESDSGIVNLKCWSLGEVVLGMGREG